MGSKKQKIKEVKTEAMKINISDRASPAIIEEIVGKTGFRGEITQVKCRIMQGDERGKVLRRNVKGPVRTSDILMLRETQIEARKIKSNITKGAFS